MQLHRPATLFTGILVASCGSMRVNVSVIDPEVVEAEIDRLLERDVLPKVAALTRQDTEAQFGAAEQLHFTLYSEAAGLAAQQLEQPNLDEDTREVLSAVAELEGDFDEVVAPYYQRTKGEIIALNQRIRHQNARMQSAKGEELERQRASLVALLRERETRLNNFAVVTRQDIDPNDRSAAGRLGGFVAATAMLGQLGVDEAKKEELVEDRDRAQTTLGALLKEQGLESDPYAHAVASADERHWATRFNRTMGRGTFGNVNVAIRMESLSNFTIKGLTFDPRDVAQMAAKVGTQAILLSAQIAGVPVSTESANGDGAAIATESTELSKLLDGLARNEAAMDDQREALVVIANAILREEGNISGLDPTLRAEAIRAIQSVYEAHLNRLAPTQGGN